MTPPKPSPLILTLHTSLTAIQSQLNHHQHQLKAIRDINIIDRPTDPRVSPGVDLTITLTMALTLSLQLDLILALFTIHRQDVHP